MALLQQSESSDVEQLINAAVNKYDSTQQTAQPQDVSSMVDSAISKYGIEPEKPEPEEEQPLTELLQFQKAGYKEPPEPPTKGMMETIAPIGEVPAVGMTGLAGFVSSPFAHMIARMKGKTPEEAKEAAREWQEKIAYKPKYEESEAIAGAVFAPFMQIYEPLKKNLAKTLKEPLSAYTGIDVSQEDAEAAVDLIVATSPVVKKAFAKAGSKGKPVEVKALEKVVTKEVKANLEMFDVGAEMASTAIELTNKGVPLEKWPTNVREWARAQKAKGLDVAAKEGAVSPIATVEDVPMPKITKEKAEALKVDLAKKQAETEIRVSQDPATGETVIKIPERRGELYPEEKPRGGVKGKTQEELAQETGRFPGRPVPEKPKVPAKIKKEYPPEYIEKQNKIIGLIDKQYEPAFKEMAIPRREWGKWYEDLREKFDPEKVSDKYDILTEEGMKDAIKSYVGKARLPRVKAGLAPEELAMKEERLPTVREMGAKEIEKEISTEKLALKKEVTKEETAMLAGTKKAMDYFESRLTDKKQQQAFQDWKENLSTRESGEKSGVSRTTISNWRKRWIEDFKEKKELREIAEKESAEVLKEYYSGYPLTKEVKTAINSIKEKLAGKRKVRMDDIKRELQKTSEGKVEWMYMDTQMKLKEKRSPQFKKAVEWARRAVVDTSGNIKSKLIKRLGSEGKEAVIHHDLIAGVSSKVERLFEDASKTIYDGLSKEEGILLDRAIQSRRTIAVSKYRPDVKHPHGLTIKEHTEYMKTISDKINKRVDAYSKEMENIIGDLRDEGLITEEAYKNLKSKGDYSPRRFIQQIDPVTTYEIGGKRITVPDSGIKALDEGSMEVMETNSKLLLADSMARTQARIFKNRANVAAHNIASELPDNGIFMLPKKGVKTPAGHTKIKAMIDGKANEIIMPDKYAKEWITRDPLIDHQLANIIGWVSGSKILKPMATGLNPGFALTNFPRDIAHVWLTTAEYSSKGIETVPFARIPFVAGKMGRDFISTAKDTFTRKGAWNDYIDEGGGMAFLTHQGRPVKPGTKGLAGFQKVMGYLGETSEIWTRLALRKRAIRKGKAPYEATWIARNYLDFSQGGNIAKALDTGIPYLNAGIQGTRGIFRALADRPVDTIMKFAEIGTIATGLYLANKYSNPECWEAVPNREKVSNFIITTPYSYKDKDGNDRHLYFKIAKDQGQRVVTTLFENLMQKYLGEKVDYDQVTQAIGDFLPVIPTEKTPPSLDAMFGYLLNKDFWRREDIWRGPKVTPREEYTSYTHPALVKIGKATGLSPERLEYSLQQYFTYGNVYTSLVSGGLNLAMKNVDKPESRKIKEEIITRLPIVKRAFRLTPSYSEKEVKEAEQAGIEESTRRYKQRRELKDLANEYYRKLKDEKINDKELLAQVKTFIREQPPEDRDRLKNYFKRYGTTYDIPNKSWWFETVGLPPETRATVYWAKYLESSEEERKELQRIAKTMSGFWSDRFFKRLKILMKK